MVNGLPAGKDAAAGAHLLENGHLVYEMAM